MPRHDIDTGGIWKFNPPVKKIAVTVTAAAMMAGSSAAVAPSVKGKNGKQMNPHHWIKAPQS